MANTDNSQMVAYNPKMASMANALISGAAPHYGPEWSHGVDANFVFAAGVSNGLPGGHVFPGGNYRFASGNPPIPGSNAGFVGYLDEAGNYVVQTNDAFANHVAAAANFGAAGNISPPENYHGAGLHSTVLLSPSPGVPWIGNSGFSLPPSPSSSVSSNPGHVPCGFLAGSPSPVVSAQPGVGPLATIGNHNFAQMAKHVAAGAPLRQRKAQEERDPKKIFIGGISHETNIESLTAYFTENYPQQFTETNNSIGQLAVVECVIKHDQMQKSRCFAFVTFKTEDMAAKVLQDGPHMLHGKVMDCKEATPHSEAMSKAAAASKRKVFVGGSPHGANEGVLREYFSRFGEIEDVMDMINDEGVGKGFAFVTFRNADDAAQVVRIGKHVILGKKVDCKAALPKVVLSASREGRDSSSVQDARRNVQNRQVGPGSNVAIAGLAAAAPPPQPPHPSFFNAPAMVFPNYSVALNHAVAAQHLAQVNGYLWHTALHQ